MNSAFIIRKSHERGHANHGWLDSYHTFSFGYYHDNKWSEFGSLRVLNEDQVDPGEGFDSHPHNNYEIFSYILNGELRHSDSMGHTEVIKRGDIQFTSAGTGIWHSEFNNSNQSKVHFLQIWVKPNQKGLTPAYQTRSFKEEDKIGRLLPIVTPKSSNENPETIKINQNINVFASILPKNQSVTYTFKGNKGFIHTCMTGGALSVNEEIKLDQGDAIFIDVEKLGKDKPITITGTSNSNTEFLLFDIEK